MKFRWPWQKKTIPSAPISHKRELIEIGRTLRVENGPALKCAIASKELLNDANTAAHYKIGAKDALNGVIELGKPMNFLDYRGSWVWYIYQWNEDKQRWLEARVENTREAAMAVAKKMRKE